MGQSFIHVVDVDLESGSLKPEGRTEGRRGTSYAKGAVVVWNWKEL